MKAIFDKVLHNERLTDREQAEFMQWAERQSPDGSAATPAQTEAEGRIVAQLASTVLDMIVSKGLLKQISDITKHAGLLQAGEFRVGNDKAPGDGFTGGRFGYPGFTYGGVEYFLVGVSNDVLQVGLSLADGTIKAAAGAITLNVDGLVLANVSGIITFLTAAGADGAYIYNQGTDDLAIQNNTAGKSINLVVTMTNDDGPNMVWGESATANKTELSIETGAAGGRVAFGLDHFIDSLPSSGTGSTTVYFNERGKDIDFIVRSSGGNNTFHVNAGDGTVNIFGDLAVGGNITWTGFLEGGVVPETNANNIYSVTSPGGTSAFAGTINGTPSGTSVVYNVTSGTEAAMVPSATTQLAKMRLYNTTRGTSALISDCNTGTNTITLTGTVPAAWANGDTITIASQTVSGGGFAWVDLEITSGPTAKTAVFINTIVASGTVGDFLRIHPTVTFAASKVIASGALVAGQNTNGFGLLPLTSNVFSLAWTGTPTQVIVREAGYIF